MEAKSAAESRISTAVVVLPVHTTQIGVMHGGELMKMMDNAAGVVSQRHCHQNPVTVSVEKMVFKESVEVGDLIIVSGELVYTGRSSMGVLVKVEREDLHTGDVNRHVMHGYWVMVALDDNGKPTEVPPLKIESPEQQKVFDEVRARLSRPFNGHGRPAAALDRGEAQLDES